MIDTTRIAAIFDRFTTGWHFYLRDLRTGEDVEQGDLKAWPIGSCFKLAVLVAYFEALTDGTLPEGSLDSESLIAPDRFRIGGGVINLLDSTVRLTDRHLVHWMLAASDGTATDILIAKLGLARINATLQRFAPASSLHADLGDMVAGFRNIPEALTCKTREWTEAEAAEFCADVAALGATNASDLAALALGACELTLPAPLAHEYERCLNTSRVYPRVATFVQPGLRYLTKSGSLGRCYFLAEGGVVRDEQGQPLASFGYCSEGWRLPAFMVETVGGLIGIEIAKALDLPFTLNADWTPEGAALLLGDLWNGR